MSDCDPILTIRAAETFEYFFGVAPEKIHSYKGTVSAFSGTTPTPLIVKAHPDGRIELSSFGEAVAVNTLPAIAQICARNPI
jgi:hypothetical protein